VPSQHKDATPKLNKNKGTPATIKHWQHLLLTGICEMAIGSINLVMIHD